jgi:hypothetical protein
MDLQRSVEGDRSGRSKTATEIRDLTALIPLYKAALDG